MSVNEPVQLDVFDENGLSLMWVQLQDIVHRPPSPSLLTDEEVRALIDAVYDEE